MSTRLNAHGLEQHFTDEFLHWADKEEEILVLRKIASEMRLAGISEKDILFLLEAGASYQRMVQNDWDSGEDL